MAKKKYKNFIFLCDYLHPKYGYQEFHLANELSKIKEIRRVVILTADRYYPFPSYEKHKIVLGERIHNKINEKIDNLNIFYFKPLLEIKTRIIPNLKFFKILISQQFDVCYSHSSTSFISIFLILISRFLPFKIFIDNHMHYVAHRDTIYTKFFYGFVSFINKYIASKNITYLGVTKESCDFLNNVEGVNKKQICLLDIGYQSKYFHVPRSKKEFIKTRQRTRESLNISNNEILIIQTGKLSFDKRPDLTIRASKINLKKIKGNILFIGAHSNSEKNELAKLFNRISTKNWKLHFIKNQEFQNLSKFYISADLLSYPGGATLSCIEGAATGCKSIVARTPEGIRRANLGIASVPINSKDLSFEELLKTEVYNLISKKKDLSFIYSESLKTSNLVKEFSYKEISKKLYKLTHKN